MGSDNPASICFEWEYRNLATRPKRGDTTRKRHQPPETLNSASAETATAASNTLPALLGAHDIMLSTLETIASSFIPIFVELEELRQQKQIINELAVKTPNIGLYLQGSITPSD